MTDTERRYSQAKHHVQARLLNPIIELLGIISEQNGSLKGAMPMIDALYRAATVASEKLSALTNPAGEGGVRARALEEAAKLADYEAELSQDNLNMDYDPNFNGPALKIAKRIARSIRALVADGGEAG